MILIVYRIITSLLDGVPFVTLTPNIKLVIQDHNGENHIQFHADRRKFEKLMFIDVYSCQKEIPSSYFSYMYVRIQIIFMA